MFKISSIYDEKLTIYGYSKRDRDFRDRIKKDLFKGCTYGFYESDNFFRIASILTKFFVSTENYLN